MAFASAAARLMRLRAMFAKNPAMQRLISKTGRGVKRVLGTKMGRTAVDYGVGYASEIGKGTKAGIGYIGKTRAGQQVRRFGSAVKKRYTNPNKLDKEGQLYEHFAKNLSGQKPGIDWGKVKGRVGWGQLGFDVGLSGLGAGFIASQMKETAKFKKKLKSMEEDLGPRAAHIEKELKRRNRRFKPVRRIEGA